MTELVISLIKGQKVIIIIKVYFFKGPKYTQILSYAEQHV